MHNSLPIVEPLPPFQREDPLVPNVGVDIQALRTVEAKADKETTGIETCASPAGSCGFR